MNLQDFTAWLEKKVKEHDLDYREHANEDPVNWPLEYNLAEWIEQFNIFMEQD